MRTRQPLIAALLALAGLSHAQSLSVLEEAVVRLHPSVESSAAGVDMAKWKAEMLMAPFRPSVSLNSYLATGTGMPIVASSVMPVNYMALGMDTFGSVNLMLMWPVYLGGRQGTSAMLGRSYVAEAQSVLAVAKRNAVFNLRAAVADALAMVEMQRAMEADLEAAIQVEADSVLRESTGSAPHAFTLRARAAARAAEGRVAQAKARVAQALSMVRQAAGGSEEVTGLEWDVELGGTGSLADAVASAVKDRSEIRAMGSRVDQQELLARLAKQSASPDVSFVAMGDIMDGSSSAFESRYKIGLVVSFPLADGGMRRAQRAESESARTMLAAELEAMRLMVRQEVESAWAEWESSGVLVSSAEAAVAASAESFRTEQLRYRSGNSILAELLDSQQMLLMSRAGLAEAVRFRRVAWSKVRRAVG